MRGQDTLSKWKSRHRDLDPRDLVRITRLLVAPEKVQVTLEYVCDPAMELIPEATVTPEEQELLRIARVIGVQEALARMVRHIDPQTPLESIRRLPTHPRPRESTRDTKRENASRRE
jgi:hypothetical protein